MQGRQGNHYDGMIIADPNMILNVTVPETVQKQADNWERGTRTLLQRPVLKASFSLPDEMTAESRDSTGHKTDDQSQHSGLDRKIGKKWHQPQKENVCEGEQKKSSAKERQKMCVEESSDFHREESSSRAHMSCCSGKNPSVQSTYKETQPLHDHYQQQTHAPAEPSPLFAQTHCIKNTTHFQHYVPPTTSLQHTCHQNTSTGGSARHKHIPATDCQTLNLSSAPDWLQYQYFKRHAQPARSSEDTEGLCWRGAALTGSVYRDSSSRLQRVTRHAALTTVLTQTGMPPPRKGLRPRCRRWTDPRIEDFVTVPQQKSPCLQQASCKGFEIRNLCWQEHGMVTSVWGVCKSPLCSERHVQPSDVLLSAASPQQDGAMTSEQSLERSALEDLTDLSVEETVDYFLKMTSPLEAEPEDTRTEWRSSVAPPALAALHWPPSPPSCTPFL